MKGRNLENKIYSIFKNADFKTDSNLRILIDEEEQELDVCCLHDDKLIWIDCKGGKQKQKYKDRLKSIKKIAEEIENSNNVQILGSKYNLIRTKDVKDKKVKIILAWPKITKNKLKIAQKYNFTILKKDDITYFDKVSSVLKGWAKYELLRELEIEKMSRKRTEEVSAIEIKQPGGKFYFLSLDPATLLQIAYVYRRDSRKELAYQRLPNPKRLDEISQFLTKPNAIIPNNIIICFDDKEYIQKKIEYKDGELEFPLFYCSAWVIDGQHRLFGFTRTKKFLKEHSSRKFQLPVIAFRKMKEVSQALLFVDINRNQVKINPNIVCDILAITKNITHPLGWPSLLVKQLNQGDVWNDKIKIYELYDDNRKRTISLSSFVQFPLLRNLLGFKKRKGKIIHNGILYNYAPFDIKKSFHNKGNKNAFEKQYRLLNEFFKIVKDVKKDEWNNTKKYAITGTTSTNALLLVLEHLMREAKSNNKFTEKKIIKFIKPKITKALSKVTFEKNFIKTFGTGWQGFTGLADEIKKYL